MRVSLSWLKEYVTIDMPVDRLVDALTMAGLEVDTVSDRYAYLERVVVGLIREVAPHPRADTLKLCDVDLGSGSVTVVCGAPNARKDLLVAVALPGAVLPDGTVLQKSVIRGSASEGMICSEQELGLGNQAGGVMELDSRLTPGRTLKSALDLADTVIDIDLTPNRPDCLSLLGIAREIAALQKTPLRYPDCRLPEGGHAIEDLTSVTIAAPALCPRYAARLLTGVTVGPSPFWLQDRLLSIGLRPINNIVDVTNFVLMELGQPLHAFDFDRLAGRRIVVRTAAAGEVFTTLDQKDRPLSPDMLLICDAERPVAIGGVMGGLNSEIEPSTTRVFIEGAYFSPASIRRTAKVLGLNTEASFRFERGVDPHRTVAALNRAARLMAEISGAELVEGLIDEHPQPADIPSVRLSVAETNRLLGTDFQAPQIAALLESIDFEVKPENGDHFTVIPPSFRVDIGRPEDLIEEVARLSGYDHILPTYPAVPVKGRPVLKKRAVRNRVKAAMAGRGFNEIITYSFIDPADGDRLGLKKDDFRRQTVAILNPLSEEQAVMRTTLVPGLLRTLQLNLTRQEKNLKLFEIGKTFFAKNAEELPEEIEMLAGLWSGSRSAFSWHGAGVDADFFDVKGVIESLFQQLDIQKIAFTAVPDDDCIYTRSGFSASILAQGKEIGVLGEINPLVRRRFELKQTAFVFELNIDRLVALVSDAKCAVSLPKYPAVSRDVTLIVDRRIEAGKILDRIEKMDEKLIDALQLFDIFEGQPIPEGRKSISFRIVYRSATRTLEDEEINRLHRQVTGYLLEEFKASLPA
ncbi:MAG: phenylalanine--tRNA ligase subunit beta [Desulfobacterales bacterium]